MSCYYLNFCAEVNRAIATTKISQKFTIFQLCSSKEIHASAIHSMWLGCLFHVLNQIIINLETFISSSRRCSWSLLMRECRIICGPILLSSTKRKAPRSHKKTCLWHARLDTGVTGYGEIVSMSSTVQEFSMTGSTFILGIMTSDTGELHGWCDQFKMIDPLRPFHGGSNAGIQIESVILVISCREVSTSAAPPNPIKSENQKI